MDQVLIKYATLFIDDLAAFVGLYSFLVVFEISRD